MMMKEHFLRDHRYRSKAVEQIGDTVYAEDDFALIEKGLRVTKTDFVT
jgi:hypothetical protein